MGQSLKKLSSGNKEAKKEDPILREIVEKQYENIFTSDVKKEPEFYQAICETVEAINKKVGSQMKIPKTDVLEKAFKDYHKEGKPLSKEDFQKILEQMMEKAGGVTGKGFTDVLLYTFGVPASATLIKNAVMPNIISNDVLIPGLTSLTVLVLATLKKI